MSKKFNINSYLNSVYDIPEDIYWIKKDTQSIFTSRLLIQDLFGSVRIWRQIKGYPINGQSTHTNSKTPRRCNFMLNYRLKQFYLKFGKKRRDIFPTLIKAEYMNKLWFKVWTKEWGSGYKYFWYIRNRRKNSVAFDPNLLARGFANGFVRTGKAAKISKAKKITKVATVGLPLFFTRFLYCKPSESKLKFKLSIPDTTRKKMGKKKNKKKKKKNVFN